MKILDRIEQRIEREYGVKASVKDPQPLDGVVFGYSLNIGRCIGCRRCVYACMKENNLSREPQIQYIRVLKMKKEGRGIDLESSVHDYPAEEAGDPNYYYMPVQCQQCSNPPCVKVCPVKATWQEKDGIVVVDYNWCIGCRYCEAACPYHARRFNFAKPRVPGEELNPNMGYLSNRPRYMGVMEKCTFCLHRSRVGRYPACVEVCPFKAISKNALGCKVVVEAVNLGTTFPLTDGKPDAVIVRGAEAGFFKIIQRRCTGSTRRSHAIAHLSRMVLLAVVIVHRTAQGLRD